MRVPLDPWLHGPWHSPHATDGRRQAREERRGEAWARIAVQGSGLHFWCERHPSNHSGSRYPGPTGCLVRSTWGGSGNRRAGSAVPSDHRSPWVPGTASDFKQRVPVTASAPQEGTSCARGPLCLPWCVRTSSALAGGTSCLLLWNKEQAW